MEEGRGQDDEEEAYGENLGKGGFVVSRNRVIEYWNGRREERGETETYEG